MKKIIFDTNFLIDLIRFKIEWETFFDIVNEPVNFATTQNVLNELKNLANSKREESKQAKIALELITIKDFKIIKTGERKVDEELIKIADENTVVATNDIELRERLKGRKVKTIYLRAKKYLAIS